MGADENVRVDGDQAQQPLKGPGRLPYDAFAP